jgi:hypothetical protein
LRERAKLHNTGETEACGPWPQSQVGTSKASLNKGIGSQIRQEGSQVIPRTQKSARKTRVSGHMIDDSSAIDRNLNSKSGNKVERGASIGGQEQGQIVLRRQMKLSCWGLVNLKRQGVGKDDEGENRTNLTANWRRGSLLIDGTRLALPKGGGSEIRQSFF